MWLSLLPCALATTLSLSEVLARGLDDSASARSLEAQRELSRAEAMAGVYPNPLAELERVGDETEARLTVPLPLPGPATAARSSREAADSRYEADRADYAAELTRAYVELVRTEQIAALTRHNAALSEELAAGARRRLEAGEISPTEALITESMSAARSVAALRAEQDRLAAAAALEALLNLPTTGTLESEGWPQLQEPAMQRTEDPWTQAANLRADAARVQARAAAIQTLSPAATLGAINGPAGAGWILGASLELPLSAPARLHAARSNADFASAEAEKTRSSLDAARAIARARAEAAADALARSEVPGLDAAPDALAEALQAGELSLGDYAAQQALVTEALSARAELQAERELAVLALWTLNGLPPESP